MQDHGIGIPAADLPGIGIGLATSKRIVEQHGGTLTVSSQEGKGSRFTLRLPVAPEDPEQAT